MRLLSLFFVLILSGCQPASEGLLRDSQNETGIVGGYEVAKEDYLAPYLVGLLNEKDATICTATLIGQGILLTAAHCVPQNPAALRLIFDQSFSPYSPTIFAEQIFVHPLYTGRTVGTDLFDIAVITIPIMPYGYRAVDIIPDYSWVPHRSPVTVAGYGLNFSWAIKKGSGVLRATDLRLKRNYSGRTEMEISQSLAKGICNGDSGGPIFIQANHQLYLIGVTSRAYSLLFPLTPDCFMKAVATRADVFVPWIKSVLGIN